ncbi:hypothetical protein BKI52_33500 [marine bacterium AO1-C]|nr:hypothetical protein BKI52_33500 [marine bacterium AO1-C]
MENNQYFDEDGHLNDAGVMLWVDALRLKREADLPEALQEHLELCAQCRISVFDYYEFKREDDIAELANHHYFAKLDKARANAAPVVSINERRTQKTTKSLQRRIAVAASVVVLLVAGWLIVQNLGGNPQKKDIISGNQDTTQTKPLTKDSSGNNEKKLANNNTPSKKGTEDKKQNQGSEKQPDNKQEKKTPEIQDNPVFSEAIAYMDAKIANKGATRGREVPSPTLDANYTVTQGVSFAWKSGVADSYRLRVMTSKTQNTPRTIEINGGLSQYKLTGLKAGKYYWELFKVTQGRTKSVGLGRFTVK